MQFSKPEEAAKAIEMCDGKDFAGKPLNVMIHKKRNERPNTITGAVVTNLFVKNLP